MTSILSTEENVMSDLMLFAAPAVDAATFTVDRAVATAAAVTALAGAIAGGYALARPAAGAVPRRAVVALAAGVIGALTGIVVLATADGGPGTGNGVVGGCAGVVLGLIAAVSGGLALRRSRRRT
ncbi:DUF6223 family protein [Actinoplanes palleronii]|uniref:Uncharacterized protein n=1 Tax=Actinoplanes palleronii TaxID=113570 RepID=A0ABQ4BQD0_9ACTN|nr:DUF6223 family protein [Actinoplanes palleronii]GIE72884.1 hypothetical protein Apa02nite_089920 [Actinoplanes palleronii]